MSPTAPPGLASDNVTDWPIDKVKPYPGNPRRIPEQAIEKVARSIELYGWQQPLVTDPQGVVIVGHTRLLAAKHLGLTTVPVHVAHLSEEKAKEYRLADNRTSEMTGWDTQALSQELREFEASIIEEFFPDVSLDLDILADAAPTEAELALGQQAASEIPAVSEESLHTTKVECPACFEQFAVRTRSLPGMDTKAIQELISGGDA